MNDEKLVINSIRDALGVKMVTLQQIVHHNTRRRRGRANTVSPCSMCSNRVLRKVLDKNSGICDLCKDFKDQEGFGANF